MRLHFPNERLRVFCHLSNGQMNCFDAFSRTAFEIGLVKGEAVPPELTEDLPCGSLRAARYVLEDCARQVPAIASRKERIWQELLSEVEEYKKTVPACRQDKSGDDDIKGSQRHCGQLAPVVMDLLLQHLRAYI